MAFRFLLIALAACGFAFLFPGALPVLAQTDGLTEVAETANFGSNDLLSIIGTIINVFLGLLGIIFLILVIYSGFLWMTAGGDDEQVNRAKRTLINGVVGLVIVMFSFAITSFVINALTDAINGGSGGAGGNGSVTIEPLSGSLGSGALRDHYPNRNQTDVARNTNIIVTFADAMDIESFVTGYDTNDTPLDTADDTVATAINAENVLIYRSADGEDAALTNVDVSFSTDLKTFVFNPVDYLGSPTEDVSYTVFLGTDILDADGNKVFTGLNDEGYEWSFETGVNLDLDPPTVTSVTPVAGGTYAKNIVVQITFDEAIDPTSATGVREASSGFQNIQVTGTDGVPTTGEYLISNGYKTITFQSNTDCGTNSCGEQIFCLPGGQTISATAFAADLGSSPPQADFPYNGVVDVAANSLDANNDGTAGDDYTWNFTTTNEIYLKGSSIESITPNILEGGVALDQEISMIFSDVVMSSTISSENITLTNREIVSGSSHEQWYRFDVGYLTSADEEVIGTDMIPAKSVVTMPHGVMLESIDGKTYMYGVTATEGIQNEYQNCYLPAEGPDEVGGECAVTEAAPYCCNGLPQSEACALF